MFKFAMLIGLALRSTPPPDPMTTFWPVVPPSVNPVSESSRPPLTSVMPADGRPTSDMLVNPTPPPSTVSCGSRKMGADPDPWSVSRPEPETVSAAVPLMCLARTASLWSVSRESTSTRKLL